MSENALKITTKFDNGEYQLHAVVHSQDPVMPVPAAIFVWSKDEEGKLGEYMTLAYIDELARIPEYDPNSPPKGFGVRQLRATFAQKGFPSSEEMEKGVIVMKASFKKLIEQLTEGTIPKEEIYVV